MTEDDVKRIAQQTIEEMLGVGLPGAASMVEARGNVSYKMLGELVGRAGIQRQIVVVDLSGCSSIGGKKPWWRP